MLPRRVWVLQRPTSVSASFVRIAAIFFNGQDAIARLGLGEQSCF